MFWTFKTFYKTNYAIVQTASGSILTATNKIIRARSLWWDWQSLQGRKMLMLNAHACLAFFRNGDYFLSLHSQLTSACKIRALRNLFVSVGNPRKGCESKSYYQNPKIRSVRQTVANDVINGRSCINRKQAKTLIKRELWYEEPKYITRRIETDKRFIIHTTSI